MKHILRIFIVVCITLGLTACAQAPSAAPSVVFYYCAATPSYDTIATVTATESRANIPVDASLEDILRIYIMGPEAEDLRSPFPAGLQLIRAYQEEGTVFVTLSEEMADLTNLDLTIACGCITLTCLELTDAQHVTIEAENALLGGQKSITMDQNSLLLKDQAAEGA